ncbi:MAG: hypothetical protein PVJ66_07510 [Gammaproteobacteria bacterium]|jgi:hypothetical protein
MNTNKISKGLVALGTVIASLLMVPRAFAIDPSHLVQEGNANCSDYGSNKLIFEIDDSSLTINGPTMPGVNKETLDDGVVQVTYWIDTDSTGKQVLKFSDAEYLATGLPAGINVFIARGDQNKAETYMWGTGEGVTRWPPFIGSSVELTVTPPQTSIESIALCYGLGLGEEETAIIPACDQPDDSTEPDEFPGLNCQTGDEFLSRLSEGERDYCCCPPPAGTDTSTLDSYCVEGTGIVGCVLGSDDPEIGCGSDTEFSDFSEDLIGAGSGTRVCKNTSSGYICYYER